MGVRFASQIQYKTVSEIRNAGVSFALRLDPGELFTGTPTVAEVTTSDLTITNQGLNTAELTILGVTNAIGQVIVFTVAGGVAGQRYAILCNCDTDAGNAQTLFGGQYLEVVAD